MEVEGLSGTATPEMLMNIGLMTAVKLLMPLSWEGQQPPRLKYLAKTVVR
jgi:hypothetical protein